jgi:HEAT repeat protein
MQEVNDLIEQLKSPSPEARLRAAHDLGQLGPAAGCAAMPLWELLRGLEDAGDCRAVRDALAAVAPEKKAIWDALDHFRMERIAERAAARTHSPAEARKLIEDVIWSFGDSSPPDGGLTGQGVKMLALGLEHPEVLPDLVAHFRAEPRLRGQLGVVLEHIDLHGGEVTEHLLPLLGDSDRAVAEAAACKMAYFGHLGPRGGEVVEALVAMFESEHDSSDRAAKALAAMESGDWGHAVVGALARSIRQGPEWETGWHRYDLLRQMTRWSADGPGIAALLDLLRDGDPLVREGAAAACRGVEAEKVVLALCQALADEQPAVRYEAVCSLQWCPKRLGGAVVPHLVAVLRGDDTRAAGVAACCLGRLGAVAKGALPAVRARLRVSKAAVAELRAALAREREAYAALREQLREELEAAKMIREAAVRLRDAAAGE